MSGKPTTAAVKAFLEREYPSLRLIDARTKGTSPKRLVCLVEARAARRTRNPIGFRRQLTLVLTETGDLVRQDAPAT